jgi:hypothetical protein
MSAVDKRFKIGEVIVYFPPDEEDDDLKFFRVSEFPENYAAPIRTQGDGQRYCVELLNPDPSHFQPIPLLIITITPTNAHKYHIYNKEFKDKYAEHII